MKKGAQTKQQILEQATKLLQSQGYHATGIAQLAGEAPKGSLYFHFPGGKEEIAASAVRLSGERLASDLQLALSSCQDAGEALALVIDFLGQRLEESGYREGCPVATVALEVAHESEPIRMACADSFARWEEALRARLASLGISGERGESLAIFILSAIEGGLLLARARRSLEPLRVVAAQVRRLVAEPCS
jgi:TetR/AcrR family transcriptional regulator, lmrAB and yxaGH operons repressor